MAANKTIPLTLFERSKPFLCVALGITSFGGAKWQQMRKEKKVEYLTLMNDRLTSEPVDCPTTLTHDQINNEYKFRKVSISGTMDTQHNIYISPRKPPYSAKIRNININDPSQLGGYVYTPVLTKSGDMVLVNRGWIPKEQVPVNESNESKQKQSSLVPVSFEGLITPLKAIPKFVKEAATVNVEHNVWPFMDNELLKQRFAATVPSDTDEKEFVVVDVLQPQNEMGTFPHRVQQNDLLMVNIPPIQHSVYVWMMCCTGIACFYYSYYFWKHPRSLKKMNVLLQKQRMTPLNAARNNTQKKPL